MTVSSTVPRNLALLVAILALGFVFAAYLQPEMIVSLAAQLWACF